MTTRTSPPPNADPQPLVLTEGFARSTTRNLARNLEAVVLLVQALLIINAALLEETRPGGKEILLLLAGLHFGLAVAAYQKGGLFRLGGAWAMIYIAGILLMSLITGLVLLREAYGAEPACVQLCGYSGPPIALFAFYPWISLERDYLRPSIHVAVLAVVTLEPLAVMLFLNGYVTGVHFVSAGITAFITLTAYGIGKVLGALCNSAARMQVIALRNEYEKLFGYLHTEVEGIIGVIHIHFENNDYDRVLESLYELAGLVIMKRVALSLAHPQVSVPELLNLHARRVSPAVMVTPPNASGLSLPREKAILLHDTLGNLLKNAVVHGAKTVRLGLDITEDRFELEVADDGPGFSADVLDNPSLSLHKLRGRIRDQSGDLVLVSGTERGATLRMTLPLESERPGKRR